MTTQIEARELAQQFGVRMCDENGNTHDEELYCLGLDDIIDMIDVTKALIRHTPDAKKMVAQPEQQPDYAYPTIEDYEEIVGFKVNDAFKMAWAMARTTNDLFAQMTNQMEQS